MVISGKPPSDAELFVADTPRGDRGQLLDDIAELLDEPAAFVPIRDGGVVRLIPKHAIEWVGVRQRDPDAPATASEESPEMFTLYDRRHRVEIDVAGTGRLAGIFLDSSPSDRPRVIDYLNRAIRFVRLWTPEEQVLINKSLILEVIEMPEAE